MVASARWIRFETMLLKKSWQDKDMKNQSLDLLVFGILQFHSETENLAYLKILTS